VVTHGRDGHPSAPDESRDVTAAEVAEVLAAPGARVTVVSHRNPDGDALGSMLALHRALVAAGQDSVMCHPDPEPVVEDLAFMFGPGEEVGHGLPADAADRILVAVDCASALRLWPDERPPHEGVRLLVNIDHHHDNTRFGHLNLVEPAASSSAEVVVHVLEAAGWGIDERTALPLYVGLLTDTGRFCYSNTGVEAHRIAARLLLAGVDPSDVAQRLYERQPVERQRLLGLALSRMRPLADGRMLAAVLGPDDFRDAHGDDTEGIVEVMRATRGVSAAALVRELRPGAYRVSLRSADPRLDVSAIARVDGGGGHRAAAGFSTARAPEDLLAWLGASVAAQLDGAPPPDA
jgi:bifunctional oligoribonuclease and PAP phosphatase NrnA